MNTLEGALFIGYTIMSVGDIMCTQVDTQYTAEIPSVQCAHTMMTVREYRQYTGIFGTPGFPHKFNGLSTTLPTLIMVLSWCYSYPPAY